MGGDKDQVVIKSGLKLKKGSLFKKKKKVDLREIDLTIKKDEQKSVKTAAELAFEKRQRDTAFERLSKKAAISHREKVEQFNKAMDSLTEFNDIPKISLNVVFRCNEDSVYLISIGPVVCLGVMG